MFYVYSIIQAQYHSMQKSSSSSHLISGFKCFFQHFDLHLCWSFIPSQVPGGFQAFRGKKSFFASYVNQQNYTLFCCESINISVHFFKGVPRYVNYFVHVHVTANIRCMTCIHTFFCGARQHQHVALCVHCVCLLCIVYVCML